MDTRQEEIVYRVLLVDDKMTTVSFLGRFLRELGYEVVPAYNGEEALKLYEAGSFDIVVTDIRMEPMDGVTLLTELHRKDADLPAIMISGMNDVRAASEAMKAGAFDYLEKPFDGYELAATMNRALAYRQAASGLLNLALLY